MQDTRDLAHQGHLTEVINEMHRADDGNYSSRILVEVLTLDNLMALRACLHDHGYVHSCRCSREMFGYAWRPSLG